MNRTMGFGEIVVGRAAMPATISKVTGSQAALETFRASRRRAAEKQAIIDQLSAMDERMLSDIGIARGQIGEVATTSVGETTGLALAIAGFVADVALRPLMAMYRRHAANLELSRLDDHLLQDIGLTRAEIPALLNGGATAISKTRAEATVDIARPVRQWNRSRVTAKTLHRLDNRMLSDIGYVRGDIDNVADELAARSLAAANRNDFQPRAA